MQSAARPSRSSVVRNEFSWCTRVLFHRYAGCNVIAGDSRSEYEKRMHRVVEFIGRQLDRPLDLEALAKVVNFSPFHFHRLFSAWMGETIGDYVRRRRVEVAAMRLVAQPRVPVLQIALSVGFGSAEAFARAFKDRFGCSASAWREQEAGRRMLKRNSGQMDRKISQTAETGRRKNTASSNHEPEASMNVKLTQRQPANVAYLRHVGPYGVPISLFWMNNVYPWMVANGLLDRPRYGISHDDPSITGADQCRYDACVEVPPDLVLSGNAFKTTIPGGTYAVLGFKGTVPEVEETWKALLKDWLPASGLQLDARPSFEYYPGGSKFDPQTGVFDCEICIPVVPL